MEGRGGRLRYRVIRRRGAGNALMTKELCEGAGGGASGQKVWKGLRIRSRRGASPGWSIRSTMSSGGCVAASKRRRATWMGSAGSWCSKGRGIPRKGGGGGRGLSDRCRVQVECSVAPKLPYEIAHRVGRRRQRDSKHLG